MMRRSQTTLVLVIVACGLLALAISEGPGAAQPSGAATAAAGGTRIATVAHAAAASAAERSWRLTLSPAPDDLALAEIRFHGSARQRLSAQLLQVVVAGPFGDDYLAVATPRFATPGGSRALVALVNRPSPLLDPASVRLRVSARDWLGAPAIRTLGDALARSSADPRPALCDLSLHGSPLTGQQMSALGSRGTALAGFDVASAVAQAYDVACGLPYASSFKQAVEQPSPSPSEPQPVPPEPAPPHCPPCDPPPGYACPLALTPSVCVAAEALSARRAHAGAH